MNQSPLLEVEDLQVSFINNKEQVRAVRGVTFTLNSGETVAIVGESGCGKSVTAHAIAQLLKAATSSCNITGNIVFSGKNLLEASEKDIRLIRSKDIGMIFQDPQAALNPALTIGTQLVEGLSLPKHEHRDFAIGILKDVGIADPTEIVSRYPHEMSGGMKQRIIIGMALAKKPQLLIADEPTTALDTTVQLQILELLLKEQQQSSMAILLITHDLGVVARCAKKVVVMYAGKIIEAGDADQVLNHPQHPYTRGLIRAKPTLAPTLIKPVPIPGQPPNLLGIIEGCAFWPRCKQAMNICAKHEPKLMQANKSQAACWLLQQRS